jgi:hypothetical protein
MPSGESKAIIDRLGTLENEINNMMQAAMAPAALCAAPNLSPTP